MPYKKDLLCMSFSYTIIGTIHKLGMPLRSFFPILFSIPSYKLNNQNLEKKSNRLSLWNIYAMESQCCMTVCQCLFTGIFFLQDYFFKLEKSCKFAKNLPEICTNLSKFARNVQIYNKKKNSFYFKFAKNLRPRFH